MKTIPLIIILLFIITLSQAQTPVRYTYDYLTKIFTDNNGEALTPKRNSGDWEVNAKKGETVRIEIINLNRVLYKTETTKSEIDFNIALPSAFKSIKLPPYAFNKPSLQALSDSLGSLKKLEEDLNSIYRSFENYNEQLKRFQKFENALYAISRNCRDDYAIIQGKLITDTKIFVKDPGYISDNETSPEKVGNGLKEYLDDLQNNIANSAEYLKSTIPVYIQQLEKQYDEIIKTHQTDIEELTNRSWENESEKSSIFDHINTLKYKIKKLEDSLKKDKSEINLLKEISDSASELLSQHEKNNKFYLLHRAYLLLANKSNFKYLSETVSVNKDITTINVSIIPTDLNECSPPEKIDIIFKIKAINGVKVDFSSGAFWSSGLGNMDFLDANYYYKYHTADTREIIRSDRKAYEGMLSVGGLAHLYCRTKRTWQTGFNAGVSTTAGFDNLNFHFGGSLFKFINSSDRLILNLGITLKSTKLLDRGLTAGKIYTKLESPDAIPLISVFPKIGGFVSISYNFSRLKGE